MLKSFERLEGFVCCDCENRGCCTNEVVIKCAIEQFGLSDKCLSPYDYITVLNKYLEEEL